jgi:hypothetical protein
MTKNIKLDLAEISSPAWVGLFVEREEAIGIGEPDAEWYSRQPSYFRIGKNMSNATGISFGENTGEDIEIVGLGVWDEEKGGEPLALCTVPAILVRTGDIPTISKGALTIRIEPAVASDQSSR